MKPTYKTIAETALISGGIFAAVSYTTMRTMIARRSMGNIIRQRSLSRLHDSYTHPDSDQYAYHLYMEEHGKAIREYMQDVPEEEMTAESDGLLLKGYLRRNHSHDYVIAFHGYRATHTEIDTLGFGVLFHELGYNVLAVDQRASGNSEGKYIGMGWLERKDVLAWVKLVTEKDSEARIILLGESMGAATVLAASGEDLPANVIAVIADAGYRNAYVMFETSMKNIVGFTPKLLLNGASLWAKACAGYGFREADIRGQVAKSTVPVLLFHGSKDSIVPYTNMRILYEAKEKGKKEMHAASGADHVASLFFLKEEYSETIQKFLKEAEA